MLDYTFLFKEKRFNMKYKITYIMVLHSTNFNTNTKKGQF